MKTNKPKIFCALDTNDMNQALELAKTIGPVTGGLKLGLEFFSAFGADGVEKIMAAAPNAAIFLDLKFHDIPNTVAKAVQTLSHRLKPAYLNVHAAGGLEMMQAAKKACHPDTKLLAVTILTSLAQTDLARMNIVQSIDIQVQDLATLTKEAGLDGVVCSAHEINTLRQALGQNFTLMVPGIRPAGAAQGDQKRVMTPNEALEKGADHLVIGRPITESKNPAAAATEILNTL